MAPQPNDMIRVGDFFRSTVKDESPITSIDADQKIPSPRSFIDECKKYGSDVRSYFQGDPVSEEYLNRPHMCDTCGKRFTLLENLNRHQMIHTDERPYVCNYCNKRFRLAQHLKEHIRIHTGEKPYKCPTCGRAFCQISNLKSHQKTHTKIKAFKCDICEKSFRRSFTLKQHKLTHTRRSFSGTVGRAQNELSTPHHKKVTRKSSAPTPTLLYSDGNAKSYPSNDMTSQKVSQPSFSPFSSYRSEPGVFAYPNHPGCTTSLTAPLMSESLPASSAQLPKLAPIPIIKQELVSPPCTSTDMSYFPSLSALLRNESDVTPNLVQPTTSLASVKMLRYYDSIPPNNPFTPKIDGTSLSVHVPFEYKVDHNNGKYPAKTNDTQRILTDCIHCDRNFSNGEELRTHVIDEHNRKDLRRDSAYSSHSDKSLPSSPNTKNSLSSSVSAATSCSNDVKSMASTHISESAFMQRVKELAFKSLGRSESTRNYVTVTPPTSQQESNDNKKANEEVTGPSVGNSPTENDGKEVSHESNDDHHTSADEMKSPEKKVIKRASDKPQKWKRQLCNEWYEVPAKKSSNDNVMQDEKTTVQYEDNHKNDENFATDTNNSEGVASASQNASVVSHEDVTLETQNSNLLINAAMPSPGFDLRRFAPIVEWKPVVTGWKDMVYGTMYAVPPQIQQGFLGLTTPLADPRLMYGHNVMHDISGDKIKSGDCNNEPGIEAHHHLNIDPTARYFRFSPNTIQNFAHGNESQTPTTPESATSGVYNQYYPAEPLPIPGYSRLQHALLYNWDPNRTRLEGTSSVPQSANLVPAN